jgi:hypothetical protein
MVVNVLGIKWYSNADKRVRRRESRMGTRVTVLMRGGELAMTSDKEGVNIRTTNIEKGSDYMAEDVLRGVLLEGSGGTIMPDQRSTPTCEVRPK